MNKQTENLKEKFNKALRLLEPADPDRMKNFNRRKDAIISLLLNACKDAGMVFVSKQAIAGLDLEHPEYYENQEFIVVPSKYVIPIDLQEGL